jgi:hypothetical protein
VRKRGSLSVNPCFFPFLGHDCMSSRGSLDTCHTQYWLATSTSCERVVSPFFSAQSQIRKLWWRIARTGCSQYGPACRRNIDSVCLLEDMVSAHICCGTAENPTKSYRNTTSSYIFLSDSIAYAYLLTIGFSSISSPESALCRPLQCSTPKMPFPASG